MTWTLNEFKPASAKALARFFYARVPGAARLRFAFKDVASHYHSKPEFNGLARLSLREGEIVDVGANRGQTAAAFMRLAPGRRIVAFEPDPRCGAHLRGRLRGWNAEFHACALGREAGQLAFFVPRYGMWECDGMATTSRDEATLWLRDGGRMFRFDERLLSVEEHRVECRTLDSFALSPALIKLHAQGAELDILQGACDTLRRRPALMCAFVRPAIVDFLQGFGYRPYVCRRDGFVPGVAAFNTTFTWFLTCGHDVANKRTAA
jgi:FkbM family methyltransferase